MSGIEIRPALPAEYDRLGQITADIYIADGFLDPGSDYAGALRDAAGRAREALVLTAIADGELVGTVTYCPADASMNNIARAGEAEIRMLAVTPEARGRGVGEALVRACIDRARADGLRGVALSTQTDMTAAQRMYERLGFVRTPERDWSPVPGLPLVTYVLTWGNQRDGGG